MATPLLMPSLSPTMEEGTIAKWMVKEGDAIKTGTLLCSIETDKTTVDYESLEEGFLRKIVLGDGKTAKVNQLIALITDDANEDFNEALKSEQEKSAALDAKAATPSPAKAEGSDTSQADKAKENAKEKGAARSAPPARQLSNSRPSPKPNQSQAIQSTNEHSGRIFASPLAKKMANDQGIHLDQIQGSGPSGRITSSDVQSYTPSVPNAASPAAKKAESKPVYGSLAPVYETQDIQVSQMRRVIGKRLLDSWQGAPCFFVTMKMQVDALQELRKSLNQHAGYKISLNDLVIKCTALALRQIPQVNSTYHGDSIRQHSNIDICVAVAIDSGLITPIVTDVDLKGLGQISVEVKDLAAKAKAGTLAPEQYQGGTFTISNLGMFGVSEFTAIINPPQSAILAVAGIESELYKQDDQIKEKQVMNCTITCDHRVIDGALAARFMSALKNIIENPSALLL